MNSEGILIIARSHLPNVFNVMVLAAVIFFASFIWAILPEKFRLLNQWGRNILRQAPSIMTALGLFGTFYGLTESLRNFGTEVEQIQIFISELKSVFIYSILGIGSAVVFMVLNVIVNAIHHHRTQLEQRKVLTEYNQRNKNIQQNNDAILQYLAAQLNTLNQISSQLKEQENIQNPKIITAHSENAAQLSAETQHILQQQAEFAPYLVELANIQETLSKIVSKLLIPYINYNKDFHQNLLNSLTEKMDSQNQILLQIHTQLEKYHHEYQVFLQNQEHDVTSVATTQSIHNPLDPFKKLEQELEELSNENKKLFANKFSN